MSAQTTKREKLWCTVQRVRPQVLNFKLMLRVRFESASRLAAPDSEFAEAPPPAMSESADSESAGESADSESGTRSASAESYGTVRYGTPGHSVHQGHKVLI